MPDFASVNPISSVGPSTGRRPVARGILLAWRTAAAIASMLVLSATSFGQPCSNPPNLFAQAATCAVQLNWSFVNLATSYTVVRATSPGGPTTTIASVSSTGLVDTSVVTGVTYYYQVRASVVPTPVCPGGITNWSAPAVVGLPAIPPPGNFAANNLCQPIELTWNPVAGASSYQVQASATADFAVLLESVSVTAPTTSYTSTVSSIGTFHFRVRAATACGAGIWATTTGQRVGPAGPVSVLDASEIESCGGVLLRWEPATRATGYRVFRIWNNQGVSIDTTNTWLLDTGAPRDVDLTYSVAAMNECGPVTYSPGTARVGARMSSLRFIERPQSVRTTRGQTVVLRARVDPVAGANARYQWQTWNGRVVDDGRITGATTPELTIRDVRQSDMHVYQLQVRRTGFVYYDEVSAAVIVDPFCAADHNGNGSVGVQDLFDFLADFFGSCF